MASFQNLFNLDQKNLKIYLKDSIVVRDDSEK